VVFWDGKWHQRVGSLIRLSHSSFNFIVVRGYTQGSTNIITVCPSKHRSKGLLQTNIWMQDKNDVDNLGRRNPHNTIGHSNLCEIKSSSFILGRCREPKGFRVIGFIFANEPIDSKHNLVRFCRWMNRLTIIICFII
jgi:hypothetical protein